VRTPELVELMIKKRLGEPVDERAYERALEDGVRDVVKRQAEIGIDVIDDGEYGKINWITYLCDRIGGLEPARTEAAEGSRETVCACARHHQKGEGRRYGDKLFDGGTERSGGAASERTARNDMRPACYTSPRSLSSHFTYA
jgi:methionine synthase II (cobalamin-independent)